MNYFRRYIFTIIYAVFCFTYAESPLPLQFKKIHTLKLIDLNANVRIIPKDQDFVSIELNALPAERKALSFSPEKGVLSVSFNHSYANDVSGTEYLQITFYVPKNCRFDISLKDKSHGFILAVDTPVRAELKGTSQLTIHSCTGLSLKLWDTAQAQIHNLNGALLTEIHDHAKCALAAGKVTTALIETRDHSIFTSTATFDSVKLKTNGNTRILIEEIIEKLSWSGRADEKIHINKLSGDVEVQSAYGAFFIVDEANITNLFASTAANGHIQIHGKIQNAVCSTRGNGRIELGTVEGKMVRMKETKPGSISVKNELKHDTN
jgi:hypothetical protein